MKPLDKILENAYSIKETKAGIALYSLRIGLKPNLEPIKFPQNVLHIAKLTSEPKGSYVKINKCSVWGIEVFIDFHIKVDNGYEPEDDNNMKLAILLVCPSVNTVHFSWRVSKRK